MWIQTIDAYTSAVEFRGDPNSLMVRARDKMSLENYCRVAALDPARMYQDFPSDYPWRIKVTKEEHATYAYNVVMGIDYPNFKNAAKKSRGAIYASFLMKIWTESHTLTSAEDRTANSKAWAKYDAVKKKGKSKKGKVKEPDTDIAAETIDVRWELVERHDAGPERLDAFLSEIEADRGYEEGVMGVSHLTDEEWHEFVRTNLD